jgi:hypothetical protein
MDILLSALEMQLSIATRITRRHPGPSRRGSGMNAALRSAAFMPLHRQTNSVMAANQAGFDKGFRQQTCAGIYRRDPTDLAQSGHLL